MKNELILSRKVAIETWHIQGSVAKAQSRKDMMLVLQYLDEFPRSTAKGLAGHLLFDTRARLVVAQRLLELSKLYGLTDSESGKYSLTEDGIGALTKKEVFIPEQGCWKLSVSNDTLLSHKVIEIESFEEPNAISELIGKDAKSKLEDRKQKMMQPPRWLKQCIGLELAPHAGGEKKRIDSIENKAEKSPANLSLTLEWNVSKNSIRLLDDNNSKKVLNQFEGPGLSHNAVWEILLDNEDWLGDWDRSTNQLAISFGDVDEKARKLMVADFEFKTPVISEYGVFKTQIVQGVALRAATENDAIEWTHWRLAESINAFATSNKYKQWVSEALAPFNYFDITLPERDEYAKELWSAPDNRSVNDKTKAWHLIAASDWAL